jgi:hypothetical protein
MRLYLLLLLLLVVGCSQKYYELAFRERDPAYCDRISNDDKRAACIFGLAADMDNISICDMNADYDERGPCYTYIAMLHKDEYLCAPLEEMKHREACIDGAYIAKSLEDGDVQRCKYAHHELTKGTCIMAGLSKNPSESECRKLGPDTSMCLALLAKIQKDSDVCNQIGDISYKLACLEITK